MRCISTLLKHISRFIERAEGVRWRHSDVIKRWKTHLYPLYGVNFSFHMLKSPLRHKILAKYYFFTEYLYDIMKLRRMCDVILPFPSTACTQLHVFVLCYQCAGVSNEARINAQLKWKARLMLPMRLSLMFWRGMNYCSSIRNMS